MTPPIQRLAPGVVLLTGPGVDALRYCVQTTIRARHRNGQPASRDLAQLWAVCGQADEPAPPIPETEPAQQITTEAAAKLLGCSTRQVRRLAPRLGGHLTAGRWLLDRQAVAEHQEGTTP